MSRGAAGSPRRDRKAEHLRLALDPRMQAGEAGFDRLVFEHRALPELDLSRIDLATSFLGRRLAAPLLVSCMTGGTAAAARVNRHLAIGAEAAGIALGVGSQRPAIDEPRLAASYQVRRWAPSVPLLANLGAVQLNYGYGLDECRRAVEMIGADALVLHLNPLQEAIQPEGQADFRGLADKMGAVAARLGVPVIAKEVGCGLGAPVARQLVARGIRIFDVAGSGGTSWARIEAARAGDRALGERFASWGIPTPRAIAAVAALAAELGALTVIGSGGLRDGLDAAKAIALGADLAGIAQPFLAAARRGAAAVEALAARVARELAIAMFCAGAGDLAALRRVSLDERGGGK